MNLYQIPEQFNRISHLLEQNQHIIIFEIIDVSQMTQSQQQKLSSSNNLKFVFY